MEFTLSDSHASPRDIPPIDFRAELNDEQHAAVTAEPGPMLVLAGAGSGKTRTLTYRVAYLLTRGVQPHEILLLTFTNKAAREMLSRVEDLTGIDARRFWGGTFHSIGHRILRTHGEAVGLEPGFTILDEGEAESLLREAIQSTDRHFLRDKGNPKPRVIANIISLARNTRLDIVPTLDRHFPQHREFAEDIVPFARAYEKIKRRHNVVDYDDLLELWLVLLQKAPDVAEGYRRRFRYTLVDEYQDTNVLQAEIVDRMAADHNIMAVGDDAQCIYTWRGANFENIMTFPDRHPGTRIFRIETNYRSSPEILRFANAVLRHQIAAGRGFDKELRPARPSFQKPFLVPTLDTEEQAKFVLSRLQGLIDEGRRLRDIAILYRAHYQAIDLQVLLSKAGIDYMITSGVRFFEQAHIKDVVAHLRIVFNPQDFPAFARLAVLLPKIGEKGARKLYDLAEKHAADEQTDFTEACLARPVLAKVPAPARDDWESLMQTLRDMRERAETGTPADVLSAAVEGWYGTYLKGAYANYTNRLDDLTALIGFARRYEDITELIAQITLLTSETSDRGVDDERDAVRLTTVHQAKGLEFDVVFVIGLSEGQFPLRRAIEAGDVEEERRLFYVAVTRARDELYLCHPRVSGRGGPMMHAPASQFIQEIPENLYETVHLRRSSGW
ncbi:MAG: ATP-dependent helicase [Verrucomicrobia bacterium]|nr:MAG: ATP-dependent helicase [Verrucomicrobiota bacterium]